MAKAAEVRLVAGLLSSPAESVDALAAEVIDRLDAERTKLRQPCVIVLNPTLGITQVFGPFSTPTQATRFASKHVTRYDEHTRAWLGKLVSPSLDQDPTLN